LEVRIGRRGALDHRLEPLDGQHAQAAVGALYVQAEADGEVLLIAEYDVHVPGQALVDLLRAARSTDGPPQAGPVVQVIGDNRPVPPGGGHRGRDHLGGGLGQPGVDAPGVEPAHAEGAEQVVPVHGAGGQLAGSGVAAVRDPACAAHSEAPLGEVETVADGAADTVIGHELHQRGIHPSLQDEVLDEPADVVVGQCCDDGGPQAEAAPQPAGDVVLPTSLPCGKRPG